MDQLVWLESFCSLSTQTTPGPPLDHPWATPGRPPQEPKTPTDYPWPPPLDDPWTMAPRRPLGNDP